jgi:arabinosaccharide transport system permease protein
MNEKNLINKVFIYSACLLLLLASIIPFWVLITNATRSTQQIQQSFSFMPSRFLGHNYEVLTGRGFNILNGFKNSFIIASSTTLVALYFSALTAYGLVIYEFRFKKAIFYLIAFILMIPAQISMIGFYQFMLRIKLTNSFIPLILPAIASPAYVFFIRQYLLTAFPRELVQAARIDGASEISIFHRIALPILKPGLATIGIFSFISSWNNFLMPLMLISEEEKYTLPMLVQMLRSDIYRTEYGGIYLGITMTILPLIIVYLLLSRHIIAGVASGAVKE